MADTIGQSGARPARRGRAFTLIELPAVRKHESKAFTLIELLIVIVIIGLLAGILMPTISYALSVAYSTRAMNRIHTLTDGISFYYNDNNNTYPGQRGTGDLIGAAPKPYLTGSQLLANAMFTNKADEYPRDRYLPYNAKWFHATLPAADVLSDGFPSPMAICYYPSRIGQAGLGQFRFIDNSLFTTPLCSEVTRQNGPGLKPSFEEFITDGRYEATGATPYNNGRFLLVAAGTGRRYFSHSEGSLQNW